MGNRKGTQSPKTKAKRDAKRKCLWCGRMFLSYGPQNRRCSLCEKAAYARARYCETGVVHHRVRLSKTSVRRWC